MARGPMAPGPRSAYHGRPGASSRRSRRGIAMPSTPLPSPDSSGMDEAHRRALLDFAVGHSSTVFYIADLGAGRRTRFISDNVAWVLGHAPEMFTGQPGYGTSQLHPEDRPYFAAVGRLSEVGELTLECRFRDRQSTRLNSSH